MRTNEGTIEIIGEMLLELILEVLIEVACGFGWESTAPSRKRPRSHLALACIGYFMAGAFLGACSVVVFPNRLSTNDLISMLGVLLNAAIAGTLMRAYGSFLRRRGKQPTNLATFSGGMSFALGLSGTRLAVIIWLNGALTLPDVAT